MQIEFKNVSYRYQQGTAFETSAIENINLCIPDYRFVAVMGETGSGKTTALQLVKGLLKPTDGEIIYHLGEYSENREATIVYSHQKQAKAIRTSLERVWSKIGYMFQYPEHQLFEETVALDIAYGPKNLGYTQEKTEQSVRSALETVGLDYGEYANRSPFALSGGQMRRVAMAGILAIHPEMLILDEPLSGLDPVGRIRLMDTISDLHHKQKMTTLCVTHHLDEVWEYADYFLIFSDKQLAFAGNRQEILRKWEQKMLQIAPPSVVALALRLQEKGILKTELSSLEAELSAESAFAEYICQHLLPFRT